MAMLTRSVMLGTRTRSGSTCTCPLCGGHAEGLVHHLSSEHDAASDLAASYKASDLFQPTTDATGLRVRAQIVADILDVARSATS